MTIKFYNRPSLKGHRRPRAALLAGLAAVALGLAACSSTSSSSTSVPAKSPSHTSGAEPVIGVSFYSNTIPLYVEMAVGMRQEAAAEHVKLDFQYANNSASTQTAQIEDFVTEHVSAILCSPVNPQALISAYEQADHAGIPIISVANKVPDKYETTYVGGNWTQDGQMMMQWVVDHIGGSGPIIELTGPPTISFVHDMSIGWADVLAKYPKVKVVSDLAGDLSETGGLTDATNALTAHPDVKAVVTDSDEVALGALEAMHNLHISPKKVLVTGQDGDPPNIASIKSGDGQAYDQALKPVTWGELAVKTAVGVLHGKKYGPLVATPVQIVTRSNVNSLTPSDLK
jgi:ribose transport system substrate-binding protein